MNFFDTVSFLATLSVYILCSFAGAIEECGCTWTSGSSARRSKRRRVTRLVLVRSHFCTCAGSRVARYSPCLFGVQSRRSGARFGVQRSSPRRSISPIRISPIRRSACKSRTSPRRSISPIGVQCTLLARRRSVARRSYKSRSPLLAYSACKARVAYSAFGVQKPNVGASIDIAYWRAVYSPRLFGVDPVRVDRTKAEVLSSPIRRAIDIAYSTCKAEKNASKNDRGVSIRACKARVDRYRLFDVQSRKECVQERSWRVDPRSASASKHLRVQCARGVRANDRIVFRKCMSVQDVFSCTCKA